MTRGLCHRGFTLLEVLVALGLVATVLGSALALARGAAANQVHLEQRLLAHWVADNVLASFRLEWPPLPTSGEITGRAEQLGRTFDYRLQVTQSSAEDPALARLDLAVEVYSPGQPGLLARLHDNLPAP